jgi:hypothetical protein
MVASSVFSSGQFDRTVERAVVGGQSLVMTMSKTSSPWMVDWYERGGVHRHVPYRRKEDAYSYFVARSLSGSGSSVRVRWRVP